MPLFPVEPLQEFDADKLRPVKANGNPWQPSADNPASVPVPLPVILADVLGPYTELDRKLWRFLLHVAWPDLETKRLHTVSLRDVAKLFREKNGNADYAWVMESARRLSTTRIEYKISCGDPRFHVSAEEAGEGFALFLSAAKKTDMGNLVYEIPALLIDIIKKPLRFARLRTHFVIGLHGKHAVSIYEILESFANLDSPELIVFLDEFRQWLNIKPGKYTDWRDFNKRVLAPALKQINDNPDDAGFSVEWEALKQGRAIDRLKFTLKKSGARASADSTLQDVSANVARLTKARDANAPQVPATTLQNARRLYPGANIENAHSDYLDWWESRGKKPVKRPAAHFLGFMRSWAQRRDIRPAH